eukprot:8404630-Pyramimonas_sp.AAC.1
MGDGVPFKRRAIGSLAHVFSCTRVRDSNDSYQGFPTRTHGHDADLSKVGRLIGRLIVWAGNRLNMRGLTCFSPA